VKLPASIRSLRGSISLILALLAASVLIGINETGYNQSSRALDRIQGYTVTRNEVNRLLQHVLDAETGSRGYLLTGDPRYLEPYSRATCSASSPRWIFRSACASKATRRPGSAC
jgi:CHASE3 domain sensor protein